MGDSALRLEFPQAPRLAIQARLRALSFLLEADPLPGVMETVPAYTTLVVHYDPARLSYHQVVSWVRERIGRVEDSAARPPRRIEVPVRYGGDSGPDLEAVAAATGLSPAQAIRLHAERVYTVFLLGFAPGFPYLGVLPRQLRLPRRASPRPRVPAGSVAIAGSQTGIYPIDSPGGWHWIGHTPLVLFDPRRELPFLFAPGDRVRFVPIE